MCAAAWTLWLGLGGLSVGDGSLERGLESAEAESRATTWWFAGSLRPTSHLNAIMNPSPTAPIIKYVGLDVHAKTIAVALAHAGGDVLSYGTIAPTRNS